MQTDKEIVTIKVYVSSRKDLRIVSAETGEQHLDVIARLLMEEKARVRKRVS